MFKLFLSSIVVLFAIGFCNGQESKSAFQRQMESFDNVQPEPYEKIKPLGCAHVIKINTQEQFDGINDAITSAITAGKKNIRVKIARGLYQFHENHIQRNDEQKEDVSISIEGKGVVITSDSSYYGNSINEPWQEMLYADTIIDVIDKDKKLCLLPYKNNWNEQQRENLTKVQITQWFRAPVYHVSRIDDKGIYFTATELKWEKGYANDGYNVNFDYLYLGNTPRFRLYDVSKERKCVASCFVDLSNCKYRLFSIRGIDFISNTGGYPLISMTDVAVEQVSVKKCTFEYIRGNVANFSGTNNVEFDGNIVRNTTGNEVRFVNNCPNVRVTNNTFENCGRSISNTFCVTCWECSYYIANNTFRDFGYGAIGVGIWHGFEKKNYSGGIIEHNEIYFTPTYFADAWKHMLMDSGAIYTWTQNDNVIIRYNYIHDYTGSGDNRGIFCDDGANNLKIYGNVVLNTPNCYSIDSRMAKDKGDGFTNNANNFMANNVVDNRVRFQGHSDVQRHVVKGANMIVREADYQPLNNKYDNLELMEEDIVIIYNDKTIKKHIKNCLHK